MPSEKLIAKKDNGVGWIILNNPERHNAISLDMWTAAMEAMEDFRTDKSVRVVVVTGAGGKAFASGADISKFKDERQEAAAVAHYQQTTQKAYDTVLGMPIPTIAMIRGYCIGAAPRSPCAATSASAPRTPSSACRRRSSAWAMA